MTSTRLKGQCASPGLASGVVAQLVTQSTRQYKQGDRVSETRALSAAIAQAISEVQDLSAGTEGEAADMLTFQQAMLEDETLSEPAFAAIGQGMAADRAWQQAMENEIAGYESSHDEYFRARASDLIDIRERVLDALTGASLPSVMPGSIILADDMTPSRFLSAEWQGGAILLRKGSATSHLAMLARSRGVPMIVGLSADDIIGRSVLIDASGGLVIVDPSPDEQTSFLSDRAADVARASEAELFARHPAITACGVAITTLINVSHPDELSDFDPAICDGIGLVRTELLFAGKALPSEDQQYEAYAHIMRWAAGRPVTFRTLDAGGDKPIAGLTPNDESNPFLGVRGVRLTLRRHDVFMPQLRALARAASLGQLEIMIPMVTIPAELEASRALLLQACVELANENVAHRLPALGIMVEVPAVALTLETFDAAFLCIGSNDLTQYVMAAGRDISGVAQLADQGHPALLRLISLICEHGKNTGQKISLCGDAAGDERLIPLMLQTGIRTVSMAPRLIGRVKRAIAQVNLRGSDG